ncbi:DUF397 domain-containing protein [Nocardia callitridis]|uniref:DUF397 domain-containing protein n=1 Tax=Nocardia callitridis TaxID=648753 RepID=A0ABP9KH61_9NOCA
MSTHFFKSSYSGGDKTCVEVGHTHDAVLIRDDKYVGEKSQQPTISVAAEEWSKFLDLAVSSSSGNIGEVEVAVLRDGGAAISSGETTLVFNRDEWEAFAKGVADGEFNRPS